jgi:TPP-dependent 2-oxoacid decarboxylase
MRNTMQPEMQLGDFLVAYLQRLGVKHIFGLPGDLVLGLFERLGAPGGLEIITLSHEPGIGFAADGYARATRRMGVACVTYGAGGRNIVNAVAGAYAERVPFLTISGGPGAAEAAAASVHHQAKHIDDQAAIFSHVTCASCAISTPVMAAADIHAVVTQMLSDSLPGYLEIRRDLVDMVIPVPAHIRDWDGTVLPTESHTTRLNEAIEEAAAWLRTAQRPLIMSGAEIYRQSCEGGLLRLAEALGTAVVTSVLGKGSFPMEHPLYMGVFNGSASPAAIEQRMHDADVVLLLGVQLTDMNLGPEQWKVPREASVWAVPDAVHIKHHTFDKVHLHDFVDKLASTADLPNFRESVTTYDNLVRTAPTTAAALTINDMLLEINLFLSTRSGFNVLAESGDSLFGGIELLVKNGLYLAQARCHFFAHHLFQLSAAQGHKDMPPVTT